MAIAVLLAVRVAVLCVLGGGDFQEGQHAVVLT